MAEYFIPAGFEIVDQGLGQEEIAAEQVASQFDHENIDLDKVQL